MNKRQHAFDARFSLWLALAGLLTFLFHEAGHWLCGRALGYAADFHLNGVGYPHDILLRHRIMADLAGPLVTIVQALVAWTIVRRTASHRAFAFVYFAAFMRLVAFGISFIHPNDEARVSAAAGLPFWVLPLLVSAGLVALVWRASRRLGIGWREQLLCYLVASLTNTLIVVADRML